MESKANSSTAAIETAENLTVPAKKAGKAKAKSQHTKATHPPTSEMVHAAIRELKDRKGSSVQAIKKYITTTYEVDGEKFAPFIKRYLKSAVTSGAVVQTKGKGASGSFKLSMGRTDRSKLKKGLRSLKKLESQNVPSVEKKTVAKKTVSKKVAASPKKAVAEKKAAPVKKAAAKTTAAKSKADVKTVSKSKKTTKAPAAKTRIPKPKKAAAKSAKK
ncbi:histone H1 [Megachile rotundata]|uniref:histone H1 n=1 Tax=Megachile rotundata TaxID=143995 RepID=UPI000258E6A1|nr:PREDICTED: histone H1-like [Megachile rotundata]XP_012153581.1 PREDICTED: histone H1-like [Megachile rotundata]